MKSLKSFFLRASLGSLARTGWHAPFIRILKSAITEHPDNRVSKDQECLTVLALSPEGFRGDLEALARSGECRVLLMATTWQYRILYLFYPEGLRPRDYLNPADDSAEFKFKRAIQKFYGSLLPVLYDRLGINCVISYHIRVPADVDWGIASREAGYPYVVFYREGLIASSPNVCKTMSTLFGRFGFWGTHLIVHNESARRLCIKTGLVESGKVSALGCIRMDSFFEHVSEQQSVENKRKKVTLFPIGLKEGSILDFTLLPFFNGMHIALVRLAQKYPGVDFVFKPKPKVYPGWRKLVNKAFAEAGIDIGKLSNLIIDTDLDAQKLILESSVICGVNSTTILEASIAGKPVVVPYFEQLRKKPYVDSIRFIDAFPYLDVAADPKSFAALIEKRLEDPEISKQDMAGRREIFEKYVSNPDGGALDKYVQLLKGLVAEAQDRSNFSISGQRQVVHSVGVINKDRV